MKFFKVSLLGVSFILGSASFQSCKDVSGMARGVSDALRIRVIVDHRVRQDDSCLIAQLATWRLEWEGYSETERSEVRQALASAQVIAFYLEPTRRTDRLDGTKTSLFLMQLGRETVGPSAWAYWRDPNGEPYQKILDSTLTWRDGNRGTESRLENGGIYIRLRSGADYSETVDIYTLSQPLFGRTNDVSQELLDLISLRRVRRHSHQSTGQLICGAQKSIVDLISEVLP